MSWDGEIVGLIPAAGMARRISPLPVSKELFPVGFQAIGEDLQPRPKVVCHYLLEKFRLAGITQAFFIIRKGKWDIPGYFGDGAFVGMELGYLIMRSSLGPPFTLDQAYPFVRNKLIAFGFPDILFEPKDVFVKLRDFQNANSPDVVLGLFPAHNPQVMDMVDIGENGKVRNMFLKPDSTNLRLCWLCGIWRPSFTEFMHEFLNTYEKDCCPQSAETDGKTPEDLPVGAVIKAAIGNGLHVSGVEFSGGRYLDIGTPEDLMKARKFPSGELSN